MLKDLPLSGGLVGDLQYCLTVIDRCFLASPSVRLCKATSKRFSPVLILRLLSIEGSVLSQHYFHPFVDHRCELTVFVIVILTHLLSSSEWEFEDSQHHTKYLNFLRKF
jgi:hypothetical protein